MPPLCFQIDHGKGKSLFSVFHVPFSIPPKGGTAMIIEERQSTHVYRQKQLFTKEELEARESLCVHEQPA